jgi:hypothetical protein
LGVGCSGMEPCLLPLPSPLFPLVFGVRVFGDKAGRKGK